MKAIRNVTMSEDELGNVIFSKNERDGFFPPHIVVDSTEPSQYARYVRKKLFIEVKIACEKKNDYRLPVSSARKHTVNRQ